MSQFATPPTPSTTTMEQPTSLTDPDLASSLDAADPEKRAAAARRLAKLFVESPNSFSQSRGQLVETLRDEAPAVRRAGADAVVSLAQTDPTVFAQPAVLADRLETIAARQPFDRLSQIALEEGIDALREQT